MDFIIREAMNTENLMYEVKVWPSTWRGEEVIQSSVNVGIKPLIHNTAILRIKRIKLKLTIDWLVVGA